jgi:putative FmdB family regulatory protein
VNRKKHSRLTRNKDVDDQTELGPNERNCAEEIEMPTYDYECGACGHGFELFQSITEPVKRKCPACGKRRLQRLFGTGAAIVFKGSGFYQTDYRSESYRKAAEADSKARSDSTGNGDKSSKKKEKKSPKTKSATTASSSPA